jgi:hypothetical protein
MCSGNLDRPLYGSAIPCVVLVLLVISMLPIPSGGENGIPFSPPTRLADFIMDMRISDVAEGSFQGEHSMPTFFELSLSGSGDVNGDGIDDLLIGSWGNNEGGDLAGQTYLIFGKAGGWSYDVNLTNSDASFIGEEDGNRSGRSVAIVGDVNGDGFDDILIGAYGGSSWTYLIFGKPSGWSMDTDLANSDASFGGEWDYAGMSVSGAGDVNDDGYDDFLIGAMAGGASLHGKAYLFLGKSSGWAMNTPTSTGASASYLGEAADDNAGVSVSGAGDVNGDGLDDFLIGAPRNDEGGSNAGQTYLIFGKTSGWSMDTNLSSADASFLGENEEDTSGYSISGAGDVNGDDYDDIIISSEGNDEGETNAGQTYLVLGKGSGWAKDTDLSASDASFFGENVDDFSGYSISGAGDVDGDGLDDILIGVPGNDDGGTSCGQTYLILGGGLSMHTDLSASDASFIGENEEDRCGNTVMGGCDLNGDGIADIVIASPTNDENGDSTGETYVITGFGNCEPLVVYSLEATDGFGDAIVKADMGDTVNLELRGLDGNTTHQDSAIVNITFDKSFPGTLHVPLRETGLNTGIYKGKYIIPPKALYFDRVHLYSRKDPTKRIDMIIDYPYRPLSISKIGTYKDPMCLKTCDKADLLDIIYLEVRGQDANALRIDKAFVNMTSDKNSSLHQMLILVETGTQSGIYRGSYQIPKTMQFFENITLTSVEDPSWTATFMIHTPVQVRSLDFSKNAYEDQLYSSTFYNFGYSSATWTCKKADAYWINWDPAEKLIAGTPSNFNIGKWTIWITAKDSEGHSDTMELNITVINEPPKIKTQDVLSVKEGEEYYVDYNCDDDLEGNITWYLTTNAPWLDLDQKTGELSGTPADYDVGVVPVKVMVDDGNDGRNWTQFDLTVENINQKPHIVTEDILSIDQNTPFRRDYDAIDPDKDDVHVWTVNSTASWLTMDPETGVLSGTPGPPDNGIYNLNVTVTDVGGLSDSHIFDLTVIDVKDKPTFIDVPPKVVDIKNGLEFLFDINATDYDGDAVTYSAMTDPKSSLKINPESGVIAWIASIRSLPSGNDLTVTVSASDGALTAAYTFTIHILITEPPVVTLITPGDKAKTPSKFTILSWNGSDPEDERILYDLYLSDLDTDVMGRRADCCIKDLDDVIYNASGLNEGATYYWIVIPNDGGSDGTCPGGMRSFKVNSPPKFSSLTDVSATSGTTFRLKVKVTDGDTEDKDNLQFDLTKYPDGMTIDEKTGTIIWTPSSDQVGDRSVTVKVTDGIEIVSYSFNIDVRQGKGSSLPIIPIFLGIVLFIIVVGAILFFLLRKKRGKTEENKETVPDETAKIIADMEKHKEGETAMDLHAPEVVHSDVPLTPQEAHANLGKDRPKTYEDMYGTPAPKMEEALTTSELKQEIGKMADELEDGSAKV